MEERNLSKGWGKIKIKQTFEVSSPVTRYVKRLIFKMSLW